MCSRGKQDWFVFFKEIKNDRNLEIGLVTSSCGSGEFFHSNKNENDFNGMLKFIITGSPYIAGNVTTCLKSDHTSYFYCLKNYLGSADKLKSGHEALFLNPMMFRFFWKNSLDSP